MLLRSRSGVIDPWDLNNHDEHLTLLQLREMGEKLQQMHPGVQDMGQSSPSQVHRFCIVLYTVHTALSNRRAKVCARLTGSVCVSHARRCTIQQPSACW